MPCYVIYVGEKRPANFVAIGFIRYVSRQFGHDQFIRRDTWWRCFSRESHEQNGRRHWSVSKWNFTTQRSSFKPFVNDGALLIPITSVFHWIREDVATSLEEKSNLWAGSELDSTTWITSLRTGACAISCEESIPQGLLGLQGLDTTQEIIVHWIGT